MFLRTIAPRHVAPRWVPLGHKHRRPTKRFAVLHVLPGHEVLLRDAPGGRTLAALPAVDEFEQPTALGVIANRRDWAAVSDPQLPNGRLGWVRIPSRSGRVSETGWELQVSLSRHRLRAIDGGRAIRTLRVGVGSVSFPTPTGRFAVTDKLPGPRFSAVYGCCILALAGRLKQRDGG